MKEDLKAALAICAAIVGAGFASGREIVTFFAGLGSASWLGVLVASAGIGYLCYVLMRLARQTGEVHLPGMYGALMGEPCRDAMFLVYGLLATIAASAMIAAGAELAALALPLHNARFLGATVTLLAAILAARAGIGALGVLGGLLAPAVVVYFLIMALQGSARPSFSPDGLLLTVPMGLLYAAFNVSLAGGAVCLTGQRTSSPARAAVLTGALLLVMLATANLALLRAGPAMRAMALPSVALAARWGVAGFYASILTMWLAILTTLCALLCALAAQGRLLKLSANASLAIASGAALLLSVWGFEALVNVAYPLLGWLCAITLVALPLFIKRDAEQD